MRKTVEIPAAGEQLKVDLTGQTIIVESAGQYSEPSAVPEMQIGDGGTRWGLYPQWVYPSDVGHFRNVTIFGTAESAGDEITLISHNVCLPFSTNNDFGGSYISEPGETFAKQASNAAQSFSDLELQNAEGKLPKRLYIYVIGDSTAATNTRGINYAYNAAPSQGDPATDAYYWTNDRGHTDFLIEPLEIIGLSWIKAFEFIAAVADETPYLIATGDY